MSKVSVTTLANLENEATAVSVINANFAAVQAAIEKQVSRDGTIPNTMSADFDINGNQILNLPTPVDATDPVRIGDLSSYGHIAELANLLDVDVSAITDGQLIYWDNTAGKFKPVDNTVTLAALTDVNLAGLADTDILQWDAGTSKFIAVAYPTFPSTVPYDIPLAFAGVPTDGEIMGRLVMVRSVSLPADFSGSYGTIVTAPTASTVITVQKGVTAIGTITISTGSAFTFATTSGLAQSLVAGDVLTFKNQATADATAADVSVTLAGTVAI